MRLFFHMNVLSHNETFTIWLLIETDEVAVVGRG